MSQTSTDSKEKTMKDDGSDATTSEDASETKSQSHPRTVTPATDWPNLKPSIKVYKMNSKPRGQALIIDIQKFTNPDLPFREGSQIDAENLKELFTQLDFNVTLLRDLKGNKMRQAIRKFSELPEHSSADMCVVAILSHGTDKEVYASDGVPILKEKILEKFNNVECDDLVDKPKFFIIQSCQGENKDYGTQQDDNGNQEFGTNVEEDMIILHSTVPGYTTLRDHHRGTWLVQALCDTFREQAADTNLRDMLDEVANRLANFQSERGEVQSCAYENRCFNKKLFFYPGFHKDKQLYPMKRSSHGLTLIINNEKFEDKSFRFGSSVDAKNLERLWTELGFKVILKTNLTKNAMEIEIGKFSRNPGHLAADMCIVTVLSQGKENDEIYCCDGFTIKTDWIFSQFNNSNCKALYGKPKMFILQACRGDEVDYGIMWKEDDSSEESSEDLVELSENLNKKLNVEMSANHSSHEAGITPVEMSTNMKPKLRPSWEDMTIAHSTVPGYISNRGEDRCSRFIKCLCDIIMKHAANTNLSDMLDEVADRISTNEREDETVGSFVYEKRHFTKKLYFNPQLNKNKVVTRRWSSSDEEDE